MKLAEILNTIVSIAAGTITILGFFGITKVSAETGAWAIDKDTLWKSIVIGVVLFSITLIFQRKKISNNISVIRSQFQFGGRNNNQSM